MRFVCPVVAVCTPVSALAACVTAVTLYATGRLTVTVTMLVVAYRQAALELIFNVKNKRYFQFEYKRVPLELTLL